MEKYTGSNRGQAAATECSGSKTKSKSKVDQAAGSQKSRNSNDTDVGTGSISLRVLECAMSFSERVLHTAIYCNLSQCQNGHVACHPCYGKLRRICHTCKSLLSHCSKSSSGESDGIRDDLLPSCLVCLQRKL
ncbi:hypothetical protein OPV22_019836 [Ensete ventricosum]|uniref:TAZ-type domain-containing protein n=1 Tax=Ensete ventricosum TaxID=4639 RepID=A0AAV8QNF5_ENSVE|nr:hypothetical protein OPV22_019836 [Ensete ventricosum]